MKAAWFCLALGLLACPASAQDKMSDMFLLSDMSSRVVFSVAPDGNITISADRTESEAVVAFLEMVIPEACALEHEDDTSRITFSVTGDGSRPYPIVTIGSRGMVTFAEQNTLSRESVRLWTVMADALRTRCVHRSVRGI